MFINDEPKDEDVGASWDDEESFDEEDEQEGDKDEEAEDEEESDDEKKSKDKDSKKDDDKKPKPVDKSAIIQKRKYREQLREAREKLKEYESKDKSSDKKEEAAKKYLAETIRSVLKGMEDEKKAKSIEAEESFEDELDEVLEETTDFSEKQIRATAKEFEVSPKKALKLLEREAKLKGSKEKPKVPQPKRGSARVEGERDKKDGPRGLDAINRSIKEMIRAGKL